MTHPRPKRLYIIGCPRSGTTWTGLLLAQHPEIAVCQQLGVVSAMNGVRNWWAAGEASGSSRFISSIVRFGAQDETPRFEQLMTRDEMRDVCRGIADATYDRASADKSDCKVVVDKTPENVRNTDVILEMIPDAYFLHLIRDPRSVFTSHRHGSKDFGGLFPTDPEGSAVYWSADVNRGRSTATRTENYRELRYESLKDNGLIELTGILDWLGVTVDREWCKAVLAKTSVETLKNSAGTPKAFFRSGKVDGWREELTAHELHVVEYHARAMMETLGYVRVSPRSDHRTARMMARVTVRAARRKFAALSTRASRWLAKQTGRSVVLVMTAHRLAPVRMHSVALAMHRLAPLRMHFHYCR